MTTSCITLPSELTVFTVAETHQRWLASWPTLPQGGDVLIEAAAVEEVDAAGVQLLASLHRTLAKRSQAMRLLHPSDTLIQACHTLGCGELAGAHAVGGAP